MFGKRYVFTILVFLLIIFKGNTDYVKAENIELEGSKITFSKLISINDSTVLVVSTIDRIYFIEDEVVKNEILITGTIKDISVLNDLNNNQFDEYLIMTTSNVSDNILLYDSMDYSKLTSFGIKMSAYSADMGYYTEIVPVHDYIVNGKQGIFIAGYNALLYDFELNKILWTFEGDNNLWDVVRVADINNDNVLDYIVSIQSSDIIALSGKNGDKIYRQKITNDKISNNITYHPSIISMQYDDINGNLYGACDSGMLYIIGIYNGVVSKTEQVFNLDDRIIDFYYTNYYRYQGLISIELILDINGDNEKDLLYRKMVSDSLDHNYVAFEIVAKEILFLIQG